MTLEFFEGVKIKNRQEKDAFQRTGKHWEGLSQSHAQEVEGCSNLRTRSSSMVGSAYSPLLPTPFAFQMIPGGNRASAASVMVPRCSVPFLRLLINQGDSERLRPEHSDKDYGDPPDSPMSALGTSVFCTRKPASCTRPKSAVPSNA